MDSQLERSSYLSICLLFLLAQSSVSVSPYVKLENGGYKNIVVAIAGDLDEAQGTDIVQSLKELFSSASNALFVATKQSAYFQEITIVIPSTWKNFNESLLNGFTSYETFYEADIRVDKPNPVFGNAPFTKQPFGCGQRGQYIHITPDYLLKPKENDELYGNRANVFVHEWAHLRYGVFEEYGYPNDPIYPLFYRHQTGIKKTFCTDNGELQGYLTGTCQNDTKKGIYTEGCKFVPNAQQTTVKSSLMSLHYLPQVKYFCTDATHNSLAPTKHNALCKGRSVWDVIVKNEDFINRTTIDDSYHNTEPKFKILKEGQTKYAILLEDTAMMNDFEKFYYIESALQRFIHLYIPSGNWLSYITFNKYPHVVRELQTITTESRKIFSNGLLRAPSAEKIANLKLAVLEAVNKLSLYENKDKAGGAVILITTGNISPKEEDLLSELCNHLQEAGTKLYIILYPSFDIDSENAALFQQLAACSGGSVHFIHERGKGDKGHISALMEIDSALRASLLPSRTSPKVIRLLEKEWMGSSHINGEFHVDPDATKNLTFHAPEYRFIKKIVLTDPLGTDYDDTYIDYKIDEKLNMIYVRIPKAEPGIWKYKVEVQEGVGEMSYPISVFSEASTFAPISVRCWTNVGNEKVKASEMPVILYAEVRQGNKAIVGARVKANVFKPRDLTTGKPDYTIINLFDNGNGDPDISEGDGIYSHYFTEFSRAGFYTFSVTVNGNSQTYVLEGSAASGILPKSPDVFTCCGSNRPSGFKEKTIPFFQREAVAGAFLVSEVSEQNNNKLPPSRIGNLEFLDSDSLRGEVTVSWTAPGSDFDTGKVSKYEIRYSDKLEYLQEAKFQQANSVTPPTPHEAGTTERATFILSEKDRYFYVGVRAWDEQNNFSPVSNIITVMVPSVPLTTTPSREDESSKVTGDDDSNSWMNSGEPKTQKASLGTILGSVFAILFIIIIAVLVYIFIYRKRRMGKYSTPRRNSDRKHSGTNAGKPVPEWQQHPKEVEMKERKKPGDGDNTAADPLLSDTKSGEVDKKEEEDHTNEDRFATTSNV